MAAMTKIELWNIFCRCSFIQQYKDNVEDPRVGSGRGDGLKVPYKEIMKTFASSDWVSFAFSWARSRQGNDFWKEIHNKWSAFVEKGATNYGLIAKWYIDPVKENYLNVFKRCSFYSSFIVNVESEDYLRQVAVDRFTDEWVGCFFDWDKTSEGYDYWQEVYDCWKRYVGTGEKEWISQWLDKGDVATAKTLGESFSVTIPKHKTITLDFKL